MPRAQGSPLSQGYFGLDIKESATQHGEGFYTSRDRIVTPRLRIAGPFEDPTQLPYDNKSWNPPPYEPVAASSLPFESRTQFYLIEPPAVTAMSLAYENRGFAEYPQSTIMDDPSAPHDHEQHMHHQQSYPSPPVPLSTEDYAQMESLELQMSEMPHTKEDEEEAGSPRAAALAKPVREIQKDENGRFKCTWNGCGEETRTFNRKCEWNKHMDKHDRPYKCNMVGCEKVPGFTYSGGLLRHQREVHNLHGGPRKQLNCPHPNCKRNSGKGFSRQENLNEHLRRVHTSATTDGEAPQQNLHQNQSRTPEETTEEESNARAGIKRKRVDEQHLQPMQSMQQPQHTNMQDDMARVIHENELLRQQVERQSGQIAELMRQLSDVQAILNPRMSQAPQAMM